MLGDIGFQLVFNNGLLLEWGNLYINAAAEMEITLPKAYTTYYLGVTDMSINANGYIPRFYKVDLTKIIIAMDAFASKVSPNAYKYWISIGY